MAGATRPVQGGAYSGPRSEPGGQNTPRAGRVVASYGTHSISNGRFTQQVDQGEFVPSNPVDETTIDDFNRADGNVAVGGPWISKDPRNLLANDLRVISNQLGTISGTQSAYTSTEVEGDDCDIVIDVSVLPAGSNAISYLFFLLTFTPNMSGYELQLLSSPANQFVLSRYTNGVQGGSLASGGLTFAVGDTVWFSKRGSDVKLYRKPSGGSYALIASVTDAGYNPASGAFGIMVPETTSRWDNLRGGPQVGTIYNDSRSGTITTSGTAVEDYSHDASGTATATVSGSGIESYSAPITYTDASTGTITASGTGVDKRIYADDATYYDNVIDVDNPVSHWKLGDPSTAVDRKGVRDLPAVNGPIGSTNSLIVNNAANIASNLVRASLQEFSVSGVTGFGIPYNTAVWSIEAWIQPASVGSPRKIIHRDVGSEALGITTGGLARVEMSDGTSVVSVDSTNSLVVGQTYHVVGIYDGVNLMLYVNGTKTGTDLPVATRDSSGNNSSPRIGSAGGTSFFDGKIDEVAWYPSALSPARVLSHYNAGVASGYDATVDVDSPVSHWKLGETGQATDRKGVRNLPAVNGPVTVADGLVANNGSDVAASRINRASNQRFGVAGSTGIGAPYSTTAWTMETWIRPDAIVFGYIIRRTGSNQNFLLQASANIQVGLSTASGGASVSGGEALVVGHAYHIVGAYDGSVLRLYIDGVLQGSFSGLSSPNTAPDNVAAIGSQESGGIGNTFPGVIDEVAYYNTALSIERILAHYRTGLRFEIGSNGTGTESLIFADAGSGTVTVTGSGIELQSVDAISTGTITTSGTGTDSRIHGDNATYYDNVIDFDHPISHYKLGGMTQAVDRMGVMNLPAENGPITISAGLVANNSSDSSNSFVRTSSQRFAKSAVAGQGLPYEKATWSVEAWVQLSSSPGVNMAIAGRGGNQTLRVGGTGTPSVRATRPGGVGTTADGNSALALGQRYHLVGTYDGTRLSLFVNGVEQNNHQAEAVLEALPNEAPGIGDQGNQGIYFEGTIDEVVWYPTALSPARVLAHYQAGTVDVGIVPPTVTASGVGVESLVYDDSGLGTVIASGTGIEVYQPPVAGIVYDDSATGTITVSGTGVESCLYTESASGTVTVSGTGSFDDYIGPVYPVATLQDNFDASLLNPQWYVLPESAAFVSIVGGRLSLELNLDGGITQIYSGITDLPSVRYSLRNSSMFVELDPPLTVTEFDARLTFWGGVNVEFYVSNWSDAVGPLLGAAVGGDFSDGFEDDYDPVAHRWLRIRESGGTIYFETSPNGGTWTEFWTIPTPSVLDGDVHSGRLYLLTNSYPASGPATAYFDNLGVAPAFVYNDSCIGIVTATGTRIESQVRSASVSGVVIASGSGTESAAHSASGTATITASGTGLEAASIFDSRTCTVTVSGIGVESSVHSASGTGTVISSGTSTESRVYTDSASGIITASGTSTESRVYTDSASGTIAASGTGTDNRIYDDSASGIITASGTGTDQRIYPDSASGTTIVSGTSSEFAVASDIRTGTIVASGTSIEDYTLGGPIYTDAISGTITAQGTATEIYVATDSATGAIIALGTSAEAFSAGDTGIGTLTVSGTGTDSTTHTSSATGVVTASGTSIESVLYVVSATGTAIANGTSAETFSHSSSATGTVVVNGTGIDSRVYDDAGSGTVLISGTGVDSYEVLIGYIDASSGQINVSGTSVESQSHTSTAIGSVLADGTSVESQLHTSTAIGSVLADGTSVESQSHTSTATGSLLTDGTSVESQSHTSTAIGSMLADGTGVESGSHTNTAIGSLFVDGESVESQSHTSTATGFLFIDGTASESYQIIYPDIADGTVTSTGTSVESVSYSYAATGTITSTGESVDEASHDNTVTGTIIWFGSGLDSYSYTDASTGVVVLTGMGHEVASVTQPTPFSTVIALNRFHVEVWNKTSIRSVVTNTAPLVVHIALQRDIKVDVTKRNAMKLTTTNR